MKNWFLSDEQVLMNRRFYERTKDVLAEIGGSVLRATYFPLALSFIFSSIFFLGSKETEQTFLDFFIIFLTSAFFILPPWLVIRFLVALISSFRH